MELKRKNNKTKKFDELKPVYGGKLNIAKTRPLSSKEIQKTISEMNRIVEREKVIIQEFAASNNG